MAARRRPAPQLALALVLVLCAAVGRAVAQGLLTRGVTLGASVKEASLKADGQRSVLEQAAHIINAWRATKQERCTTLCAPANPDALEVAAALTEAASPRAFYANDTKAAGGASLVPPPGDQETCNTCVAWTVVAAAEAAVAAYTGGVARQLFSPAYLFWCSKNTRPGCNGGWDFDDALGVMWTKGLRESSCLPYPEGLGDGGSLWDVLSCPNPASPCSTHAVDWSCQGYQLDYVWQVQQHIRKRGHAISAFQLYDDFKPFFKANPGGVYPGPGPDAQFVASHAVLLVGYDKGDSGSGGHWIALNSWGPSFGQNGIFRIAFGQAGVVGSSLQTWGVTCTPRDPTAIKARKWPLQESASAPNCYWWRAGPQDYLAVVAERFGVPVAALIRDNVDKIDDITKPPAGNCLLVCRVPKLVLETSVTTPASLGCEDKGPGAAEVEANKKALMALRKALWREGPPDWLKDNWMGPEPCKLPGPWNGVFCTDGLVTDIGNRHLQHANIETTLDAITPPLLQLRHLRTLDLSQNTVRGTLPAAWKDMATLSELTLFSNKISGTLPPVLFPLWRYSMSSFDLSDNALSGTLPPEFGDMGALTTLSLGTNKFKGSIPPNWGSNWARLEELYLDNLPGVTGQLPVRFANLTSLKYLSIEGSNFAGMIPREWGVGMRSLKMFTFRNNPHLSGCLPRQFKDRGVDSLYDPMGSPASRANTKLTGFCAAY